MTDGNGADRIRQLNDTLRCHGLGGMRLVTPGVAALGNDALTQVFSNVTSFDAFTPDNDPYGEHDCGFFEVDGERIMWKIDYYDTEFTYHSPDPSDPSVTKRVMTIMLASEY